MKIRNGFVSNSSSSSFIIVTTQEVLDKALKKLNAFGLVVFNTEYQLEKKKFGGKDVLVAYGEKSSEEFGYRACDQTGKDSCECYDEINEQMSLVEKEIVKGGGIAEGITGY